MNGQNENTPVTGQKKSKRHLFFLVVNTLLFFTLYQLLLALAEKTDQTLASFLVMAIYTALFLGFLLAYLIYNRFLYRKNLSPEHLPDTWSAEQKAAFLADGERRLEKSKWMMTIIFPLALTFLFDAIYLFLIDPLR